MITKIVPQGKLPASGHDRREKNERWQSSSENSMLPIQGAPIQSLVREVRSCKLQGMVKINFLKTREEKYDENVVG